MHQNLDRRGFLSLAGVTAAGFVTSQALTKNASAAGSQEIAATQPQTANSHDGQLNFTSEPVLMAPGSDRMTVMVGVSCASTCWVEYGVTPELGQQATGRVNGLLPYDSVVHKIRLSGLTEGTTYYYRVYAVPVTYKTAYKIMRGPAITSRVYDFRTLSPAADTCDFQMINDTHENIKTMRQLATQLTENRADFTLWNGDIFNDIHDQTQYIREILSFHGHAYAATTPLVIARGNHDVRGSLARELPRFIDVPAETPYYSFRHGPIAFIVLDSGEDKVDTHPEYGGMNDFSSYRREQYEWLLKELTQPHITTAPWRIALVHIPLRWQEQTALNNWWWDGLDKWHAALASAKVAAILSGHTHRPALLEPTSGQPFYQFVGGGPAPGNATFTRLHGTANALSLTMTRLNGEVVFTKEITQFSSGAHT